MIPKLVSTETRFSDNTLNFIAVYATDHFLFGHEVQKLLDPGGEIFETLAKYEWIERETGLALCRFQAAPVTMKTISPGRVHVYFTYTRSES